MIKPQKKGKRINSFFGREQKYNDEKICEGENQEYN